MTSSRRSPPLAIQNLSFEIEINSSFTRRKMSTHCMLSSLAIHHLPTPWYFDQIHCGMRSHILLPHISLDKNLMCPLSLMKTLAEIKNWKICSYLSEFTLLLEFEMHWLALAFPQDSNIWKPHTAMPHIAILQVEKQYCWRKNWNFMRMTSRTHLKIRDVDPIWAMTY